MNVDPNLILNILTAVATFGLLVVGLLIKNEVLKDRVTVIEALAKLTGVVNGHIETDELQFEHLNEKLDRLDNQQRSRREKS